MNLQLPEWITEFLKKQLAIVVFMLLACVYFYYDNKSIKDDLKDAQTDYKELNVYIRNQQLQVINDNTDAIREFDQTVKNYFYRPIAN